MKQLARWIDIEGRLPLLVTAGALVLTFGVLGALALVHDRRQAEPGTSDGTGDEPTLVSLGPEEALPPADQVAEAPGEGEGESPTSEPPAGGVKAASSGKLLATHEVTAGDTLYRIAQEHYGKGTYWQALADANHLGSGQIELRIGQKIGIPDLGVSPASGDRPRAPRASPDTVVLPDEPAPSLSGRPYAVQAGDTLWNIAARELGSGARWTRIADANPGVDSGTPLRVGQQLVLPDPD